MKKVICFLSIFIAGCCNMRAVMESWEGCQINEVIAQWGYPNEQREIAGRTLYIWHWGSTIYMPEYSTTSGSIGPYGSYSGSTYTTGGYPIQAYCTRILEVNESGYVVNWEYQGNDCSYCVWKNKYRK